MSVMYSIGCGKAKDCYTTTKSPYGCGEDSFFVFKNACGVADGVGGWKIYGVDPSYISKQMMMNCFNYYSIPGIVNETPTQIIYKSYKKIIKDKKVEAGSTTCSVLYYDPNTSLLHTSVMGDSGYIIYRNKCIMFIEKGNIVGDNCPAALAIIPDELYEVGMYKTNWADMKKNVHLCYEGDMIILASDGFWDNIKSIKNLQNYLNSIDGTIKTSEYAEKLVEFACNIWEKPDDITVVVSKIFKCHAK